LDPEAEPKEDNKKPEKEDKGGEDEDEFPEYEIQ